MGEVVCSNHIDEVLCNAFIEVFLDASLIVSLFITHV